jgi:cell shape-determining protein MreC
VILARGPLENVIGNSLHVLFGPIWRVTTELGDGVGNVTSSLRSKTSLVEENSRLSEALDLVAIESYSRARLLEENIELKKKLGRDPESELLLAKVLATPGVSPYDTMVVDAGSSHGVFVGMRAYGEGDFIIGEVTRVMEGSSVITLYSSAGYEHHVFIGSSSTPAIAEGMGGGSFRVTLPRGNVVSIGDLVEIPGLFASYLGVVRGLDLPEGSSFTYAYFSWPFSVYEMRNVYLSVPIETEGDLSRDSL